MSEFPIEAIAAYSTAHRIEHLFFIPIISIATSMVTLVGMFYGARRLDLIDKVISYGLIRTETEDDFEWIWETFFEHNEK